jgi:hypothetical protein
MHAAEAKDRQCTYGATVSLYAVATEVLGSTTAPLRHTSIEPRVAEGDPTHRMTQSFQPSSLPSTSAGPSDQHASESTHVGSDA